jgi:hypothetical protein
MFAIFQNDFRLLKKRGGASFDKSMMKRYSENERSRMEAYWSSDSPSTDQIVRMNARINRPENIDEDGLFIDNKIDLCGPRFTVILNDAEMDTLLRDLVYFIEHSTELENENSELLKRELKIANSSLFRLFYCYDACKRRKKLPSIQNYTFFLWLQRIQTDVILMKDAVCGTVFVKPTLATIEEGLLFAGDILAARQLIKNTFRVAMQAFALGLKMKARGADFALKPFYDAENTDAVAVTEISLNLNNLKKNWHLRNQYTSWCKYNIHKNNKVKLQYGQMNYFFRFRWYQDDEYVSNLAISSIVKRTTSLQQKVNDVSRYGLRTVTFTGAASGNAVAGVDGNDIGLTYRSIAFVPLRNFISTKVGVLGLDANNNPLLPADGKRKKMHLMTKQSKDYLSLQDVSQLKDLILIDLDPNRLSLTASTDSQQLHELDLE